MDSIKKILKLLNRREKRNLLVLFMLMLFAVLAETLGIGLIVPFVGIVTNPAIIHEQPILQFVYNLFNFNSTNAFLIFATIMLTIVYIGKNSYLIFYNYLQHRFINNQRVKRSKQLLNVYLTKPYEFHLQRNSAELQRNINTEVNRVFSGILLTSFILITESLVIFCILVLLLVTELITTLLSILILSASIFLFFKIFKKRINSIAKTQQKTSTLKIKWIKQGLGASKEVKVSGRERFFIESFGKYSEQYVIADRKFSVINQIPRMFIETIIVSTVLGMVLVIILRGSDMSNLLSTMALFAMASFRLMPSINRMMSGVTSIRYNKPALDVIYEDLLIASNFKEDNLDKTSLTEIGIDVERSNIYKRNIELKNVSYRYPDQSEYSIQNISLKIPIGKSVAFVGPSGAGKTTIVDIILGLLEPETGQVLVDGIELNEQLSIWKKKIGYIPQFIYLSDDTIRKNVAFGIAEEEIDDNAVWRALEDAQLKDFVEKLPKGIRTKVGERGVRLSGGQRQRIGIARALYYNPEILFLDEATSALDNDTEKEVMQSIDNLRGDKTLIIIAHRLSTIENCDIVFNIEKGRLIEKQKAAFLA